MTRLIVNADDFGLSRANTLGIIYAYENGIVRSTTMMVNQPDAILAGSLMKEHPGLGVGLHLNITVGRPVCDHLKTIVDEQGNFQSKVFYEKDSVFDKEEIYMEYHAQIERFIALTGKKPTHLDQHHSYINKPAHIEAMKRISDEYHIPIREGKRIYGDDYHYERVDLTREYYDTGVDIDFFIKNKGNLLAHDTIEMMTHPGFCDDSLLAWSGYSWQRVKELTIFIDPRVKKWVEDNHVELINYTSIKNT